MQKQNWGGHRLKINNVRIRSSKLFNGRLARGALNTHTLKRLGGVDIINRFCEIKVVIKKIFFEVRY